MGESWDATQRLANEDELIARWEENLAEARDNDRRLVFFVQTTDGKTEVQDTPVVDGIIAHIAITISVPGGSHFYCVPRQLLAESEQSFNFTISPAGVLTVNDARTEKMIMIYSPAGWMNVSDS